MKIHSQTEANYQLQSISYLFAFLSIVTRVFLLSFKHMSGREPLARALTTVCQYYKHFNIFFVYLVESCEICLLITFSMTHKYGNLPYVKRT